MAKAKSKNKGGRPSKFDTLDLRKVKTLAERGWTDAEMAAFFDVHVDTWHEWKKAHPEFSDSLKNWKAEADAKVERSLYERAIGYEHPEDKIFNHEGVPLVVPTVKHYPPDTTAAIFWLKNRQPGEWRDKVDHEHSGPNGGPIEIAEIRRTVVDPKGGK